VSGKELCRDVVGRRGVLVRDVDTKRQRFPAGSVMDVRQTHRGTFSLYSEELGWVLRVSRRPFDVLPPVHSVAVAHCTGCWRTWHRDDVCERREACRSDRRDCMCERTVSLFRRLAGN